MESFEWSPNRGGIDKAIALGLLIATSISGCAKLAPDPRLESLRQIDKAEVVESKPDGPIGIWKPRQKIGTEEASKFSDGCDAFRYDGETVTMFLLTMKAWMWRTEDDHYRMTAQWIGRDLYIRLPFGGWYRLARFQDGRFYGRGRVYYPIKDGALPADHPLVKKREKHDYSITPTGEHQPNWIDDDTGPEKVDEKDE